MTWKVTCILETRYSGFATFIIIILVLTLSGMGLEGYLKANAGLRMVKRQAQSHQAIYFAEGGIEWAKAQLLLDPSWQGGSRSIAEGQAKVNISKSGGGYWITSLATSGLAKREIKVYLILNSDKWSITHYQELHR